jgi:hypothetical protein
MIIDVKYISKQQRLCTGREALRRAPFQNLSNVVGAAQKTKTAASTIKATIPTPNVNNWTVTLWK